MPPARLRHVTDRIPEQRGVTQLDQHTADHRPLLDERANGRHVAQYLREVLLGVRVVVRPTRTFLREMLEAAIANAREGEPPVIRDVSMKRGRLIHILRTAEIAAVTPARALRVRGHGKRQCRSGDQGASTRSKRACVLENSHGEPPWRASYSASSRVC